MYDDIILNDCNVEIDGFPFFASEITSNESFPRRELKRTKIKNGTELVTKGEYIPREYSFKTSVEVPVEDPGVHDKIFTEMCNKPCEIVCPDMGGIFQAQVIIKKSHATGTPDFIDLDITIKEIPGIKSELPGESFTCPADVIVKPYVESKK